MSLHISPILTKYGFRKITEGENAMVQSEMMGNHCRDVDGPVHIIQSDGTLDVEIVETVGKADCGLVDLMKISVVRPGSMRTTYWYRPLHGVDYLALNYGYSIANRLADNADGFVFII